MNRVFENNSTAMITFSFADGTAFLLPDDSLNLRNISIENVEIQAKSFVITHRLTPDLFLHILSYIQISVPSSFAFLFLRRNGNVVNFCRGFIFALFVQFVIFIIILIWKLIFSRHLSSHSL